MQDIALIKRDLKYYSRSKTGLLTISEISFIMSCTLPTIYDWIHKGLLKAEKQGVKYKIHMIDFVNFLESYKKYNLGEVKDLILAKYSN